MYLTCTLIIVQLVYVFFSTAFIPRTNPYALTQLNPFSAKSLCLITSLDNPDTNWYLSEILYSETVSVFSCFRNRNLCFSAMTEDSDLNWFFIIFTSSSYGFSFEGSGLHKSTIRSYVSSPTTCH